MSISDFLGDIKPDTPIRPELYSPLGLAHVGDAVLELLLRSRAIAQGNAPVGELAKRSRGYANAKAQSLVYGLIEPLLSPEETAVMKRGRNAKSASKAKNASVIEYRKATGVEALFGYLYLKGRTDRILEIFSLMVNADLKSK